MIDYITKHHHVMRNEPFSQLSGLTVLLVEPEAETRSFYTQQLHNVDMQVVPVDSLVGLVDQTQNTNPDIIIVNPTEDMKAAMRIVRALRQQYPDLPVITMTLTMPEDTLDAMMESGVSLHINRGLTRPRDLLLALEQVIALK